MTPVALYTDSSALFPVGVVERLGVTVVPIALAVDGERFDDRADDLDGFYARLARGAKVTTSQPSPGDFAWAYARAAANGAAHVLSIHLDARVSGTTGSAEIAAREVPIPVTIVDTGTVSFGVGVCVRFAAEAIAAGAPAGEAAESARRAASVLGNAFVAPDARGRAGDVPGWTVLEFRDGAARPLAACDTEQEATAFMTALIARSEEPLRAAVGHAAAATEAGADSLAEGLARSGAVVGVERYRVNAAVGAHTGVLSFGAFWWPAGFVV